jgi:hypothetical protein
MAADPGSDDPGEIEANFETVSIDMMKSDPRLEKGTARERGSVSARIRH